MGSAISTPTYQAVNANIANDGSADSPRGLGVITTTGSFSVTRTGPSLYRVVVSSPAAAITATLPTDVKYGYRVRFEVELTSSTETNCFFTSPAIAEAQINGTGFVELMAFKDNPSVAGDWKVLDVYEALTSTVAGVGANTNTITYTLMRRNKTAWFSAFQTFDTAVASQNSIFNNVAFPVRFRPQVQQDNPWGVINNGSSWHPAFIQFRTTGFFVVTLASGSPNFSGGCSYNAQGSSSATTSSYVLFY